MEQEVTPSKVNKWHGRGLGSGLVAQHLPRLQQGPKLDWWALQERKDWREEAGINQEEIMNAYSGQIWGIAVKMMKSVSPNWLG